MWGSMRMERRGRVTSHAQLLTLLLMLPRSHLALWAASAHHWLLLSFLTKTLKSFSPELILIHSLARLYLCLGFPSRKKKVQNLVLGLVGFYEVCFSEARLCSLSRSLCMPSLPSSKSMAPRNSVSLANLLKLLSNSLSPLLTKMLNSDGP